MFPEKILTYPWPTIIAREEALLAWPIRVKTNTRNRKNPSTMWQACIYICFLLPRFSIEWLFLP